MRRTQGEWAQIVARYRASGQSARRFSADEGVGEQSLRNWTRKLKGARSLQTRTDTGFVEIGGVSRGRPPKRDSGAIGAGDGLVIRLESGLGIEVRSKTDLELLGLVLKLLGHVS